MIPDPKTIGRYEVQHVLGRGAMGVVYLAEDPLLKRTLAIKVVNALTGDSPEILERFRLESEISAKLNHPNIITIFDVGLDPVAGPFLAMEYVEGTSLAALTRQDPLPFESSIRLLLQLAQALQAAGAAGITHRDVKPDNILIARDGRLKLMDFGIARRDESRLTQAGTIFGTPAYAAPEVLVGGPASPETDRYAFVITAFELLSGTLPFQAESVGATVYRIVHDPPAMPDAFNPATRAVFLRALAKEPTDRFQDLRSFLGALIEASELAPERKVKFQALVLGEESLVATGSWSATNPGLDAARATPRSSRTTDSATVAVRQTRRDDVTAPSPVSTQPIKEARISRISRPIPLHPGRVKRLLTGLALVLFTASAVFWMTRPRPKPAPVSRELAVDSVPSGAEVILDGTPLGRTPLPVTQVPAQAERLELRLEGFEKAAHTLGPKDRTLTLTLERIAHTIGVNTDPVGAEVFLNGQKVGTSPLTSLPIPKDSERAQLTVRKKGYQDWSAQVDPDIPFPDPIALSPLARKR